MTPDLGSHPTVRPPLLPEPLAHGLQERPNSDNFRICPRVSTLTYQPVELGREEADERLGLRRVEMRTSRYSAVSKGCLAGGPDCRIPVSLACDTHRYRCAAVRRSGNLSAVRHLIRLGLAQRIVIVVGLGFGLAILGGYLLVTLNSPATFGWFGYAPLTNNSFVPEGSGLAPWQQLLIWLGLILVWSLAGLILLKPGCRAYEDEASDRR